MSSSYSQTVLQHLSANYGRMYHEPTGRFTHPYIVPGAGYEHCLWDWDMHEYYVPETGVGVMNCGFMNWNYLVAEMLDAVGWIAPCQTPAA